MSYWGIGVLGFSVLLAIYAFARGKKWIGPIHLANRKKEFWRIELGIFLGFRRNRESDGNNEELGEDEHEKSTKAD